MGQQAREVYRHLGVLKKAITGLGKKGPVLGLTPIFLDREALFRMERADYGTPDKYGRVMM